MNMGFTDYLAVGFPLIASIVLAAFFPISLRDYFVEGEIQKLGHGLTPYKFRVRHYIYIYAAYTTAAVLLSLLQAYLLWDLAEDRGMTYVLRYTDYILYPVIPSGIMAVFLMLFFFSCLYARRGEDDVRKFLLRMYDGWPLYKDIPRFKPVVLAAGILCTALNFWIYDMYVGVSDKGIVYNTELTWKPVTVDYGDIRYLEVVQSTKERDGKAVESFTLRVRNEDLRYMRTEKFLLFRKDGLEDIDRIIREAEKAKGGRINVIMSIDNSQGNVLYGSFDEPEKGIREKVR